MWAALFGSEEIPASDESVSIDLNVGEDTSPVSMLLKRMNELLVQVGELQFQKKKILEQADKEGNVLRNRITLLENQTQQLKKKNEELEFACEVSSGTIMAEQLQDVTDMRDALSLVRDQLEQELESKNGELYRNELSTQRQNEILGMFIEDTQSLIFSAEELLSHLCQMHGIRPKGLVTTLQQITELEQNRIKNKELMDAHTVKELEDTSQAQAETICRLEQQLSQQTTIMDEKIDSIKSEYLRAEKELENQLNSMTQNLCDCQEKLFLTNEQLLLQQRENEERNNRMEGLRISALRLLSSNHSDNLISSVPAANETLTDWLADVDTQLKNQSSIAKQESSDQLALIVNMKSENMSLKRKIAALTKSVATDIDIASSRHAEELLMNILQLMSADQGHESELTGAQVKLSGKGLALFQNIASAHSELAHEVLYLNESIAQKDLEAAASRKNRVETERVTETIDVLENEVAALRAAKQLAVEADAKSKELLDVLSVEKQQLECLLRELRKDNDAIRKSADLEIQQYCAKNQALEEKVNSLESNIAIFEKETADKSTRVWTLESELTSARKELLDVSVALKASLDSSNSSMLQIETALAAEKEKSAILVQGNENLAQQANSFESNSIAMRAQLQEVTTKFDNLKAENMAVKMSKDTLQKLNTSLEQQLREYREKVQALETYARNFETSNLDIMNKYKALAHEKKAAEDTAAKAHADKIETGDKLALLESQLTVWESHCHSMKQNIEVLSTEKLQLWDQLQEADDRINKMSAELTDIRSCNTSLQDAKVTHQTELNRIEHETQTFRHQSLMEIENLKRQNNVLQLEIRKFVERREELEILVDDMKQHHENLKTERDVLAARSRDLEEQLAQYTEVPSQHDPSKLLAPDLWELLYKGMEQLKVDLEVASKHAASIDDGSTNMLDGMPS